MKVFVFWTGVISLVSGAGFQIPVVAAKLLPSEPAGLLMNLCGAMAMFIGVGLILCARDLPRRGPLVMWEGVLRLGGMALMAGYGLKSGDAMLVGAGIFDGAIGLAYLWFLPRYLQTGFFDLLLDRSRPIGKRS